MSSGSLVFLPLNRARPRCRSFHSRWVHSGGFVRCSSRSLVFVSFSGCAPRVSFWRDPGVYHSGTLRGSFEFLHAMGVVQLITVHSGEPRGNRVVTCSRPGYTRNRSGSFGSLLCVPRVSFSTFRRATGVVGFIPVCLFIRTHPWGSSGLFAGTHELFGFIPAVPGCRRIHSVRLRAPQGSSGSFAVVS